MQGKQKKSIRILGIDPGTRTTGLGILTITPDGSLRLDHYECIKTNQKKSLPFRLQQIYEGLTAAINEYKPDQVALEDIFYSENIKTAIVMGHARGVALLAAINMGISPAEYSPREVKLAVVGRGNASKSQVQFMIKRLLQISEDNFPMDASDALAVAMCHYNRMNSPLAVGK